MHTFLRRLFVAGAICTLIAGSRPLVAQDSGPVTKPLSEPNITDRLPAPKPSARQMSDGRIEVSWAPIGGAVSYRMWRSVPPTPAAVVTLPNPQQSSYIDADIKMGSTYYYVVAAVNGAGIEGLRGGTTPVTAMIPLGPTTIAAPTVSARIGQEDPPTVSVSFYAMNAASYEVQRTVYSSPSADPAQIDYTRPSTVPLAPRYAVAGPSSISDPLPSAPYARSVSYAVRAMLPNGFIGPAGKGDVIIPAATPTTTTGGTTTGGTTGGGGTSGGATSGPTSLSGSTATGSTTLTVAAPTSLATGATASLASAAGSSARWLSLNDAVATVDASGIVTARAGGTTQVIAVSSSSDGSVRVVATPVTVKP